jgi:lipoprotein NlpI
VETEIAWCQFRAAEHDQAGAWQWLRWALARQPEHAEAVNMHGILLHSDGRFAEAVERFERAEELGNRASASNRGTPYWIWAGWMRLCSRTRRLSSKTRRTPERRITWR